MSKVDYGTPAGLDAAAADLIENATERQTEANKAAFAAMGQLSNRRCYRCGAREREHYGPSKKCPRAAFPYRASGDGCFRGHVSYTGRRGFSLNARQRRWLGSFLRLAARGGDMSVLVRAPEFGEVFRIFTKS